MTIDDSYEQNSSSPAPYDSEDDVKGRHRKEIRPGQAVHIVLKQDQRTGKLTRGIIEQILTNSAYHPHGIKVRLEDGRVGRVKKIEEEP